MPATENPSPATPQATGDDLAFPSATAVAVLGDRTRRDADAADAQTSSMADHGAAFDDHSVAPLLAAGAIPLGTTNVPEFGAIGPTDTKLLGRCATPWDPARDAGGSLDGRGTRRVCRDWQRTGSPVRCSCARRRPRRWRSRCGSRTPVDGTWSGPSARFGSADGPGRILRVADHSTSVGGTVRATLPEPGHVPRARQRPRWHADS